MFSTERSSLLRKQKGRCRRCALYFKDADEVEIDHLSLGGADTWENKQAFHRHCHDRKTAEDRQFKAQLKAEVSHEETAKRGAV